MTDAGTLKPGLPVGAYTISNDYVKTAGAIVIELGGTGTGAYDQLDVAGTASLGGTLDLVPLATYADSATRGTVDDFVILTAGALSGTFSTVQYDGSTLSADFGPDASAFFRSHAGGVLFRSVTYTETSVQLRNLLAAKGDADGGQDVDITDFNSLAANFDPDGATAPPSWITGNFDSDNDIDITDFNYLAADFAPEGYGASAVPEPSTFVLALLSLILLASMRRE